MMVVIGAGCTGSPPIEPGTLAQAQARILALVNATGAAIGSPAQYKPVRSADELPCYKTLLGYTVKHLDSSHASVPILFSITGNVDGPSLLPRVERYWKSRGYTIDRSGLSDPRYPKIRAHVGQDMLVATGYVGQPTMTLYGVSPCTRR